MNELKLISPIPISVNHYIKPRAFVKKVKSKIIPQVTMYETKEAKDYKKNFKKHVIDEVKKQNYSLTPNKTQHFYIDCVFYFDRIDMDANNYFKLLLDTITETQLIWIDDNVTCERVQGVYYDSNNPRIEIVIKPVDYIGIFDTVSHLDEFKQKCSKCTRFTRNCSILRKAIEGRIQEEISCGVCSKYKPKK